MPPDPTPADRNERVTRADGVGADPDRELRAARAWAEAKVERASARVASLPADSAIRSALTPRVLAAARRPIAIADEQTVGWLWWPPLVLFLDEHDPGVVTDLASRREIALSSAADDDERALIQSYYGDGHTAAAVEQLDGYVRKVRLATPRDLRGTVGSFLEALSGVDRRWSAGMFEISVKGRVLESGFPTAIEPSVSGPSRRRVDVAATVEGARVDLECAVLTDDDGSRRRWRSFVRRRRRDPKAREGVWNPSAADDRHRIWRTVYEKLARKLDPARSQFCGQNPSILALSIDCVHSAIRGRDEIVDESIAALFRPAATDGSKDELMAWLTRQPAWLRFLRRGATAAEADARLQGLVSAPRCLGGVFLFARNELARWRANPDAYPSAQVPDGVRDRLADVVRNGRVCCV